MKTILIPTLTSHFTVLYFVVSFPFTFEMFANYYFFLAVNKRLDVDSKKSQQPAMITLRVL